MLWATRYEQNKVENEKREKKICETELYGNATNCTF